MVEVHCLNLETNEDFTITFNNYYSFEKFKRKCYYSKKIMILSFKDNLKYYD